MDVSLTVTIVIALFGWLGSVFGMVLYFERRLTRVESSHGDMQEIKKEMKDLRDVILEHFRAESKKG